MKRSTNGTSRAEVSALHSSAFPIHLRSSARLSSRAAPSVKLSSGVGRFQLFTALALIVFGVSLRLLPHPANFAPIAAVSIFGGAVLPRRLAVWVPLGAMVFSDLFIGFYSTMWVTWGCYLLIALASSRWLRRPNLPRGVALTLASSLFFFVVTNFAVWVQSGMYAHTWAGFARCYVMALPFFRNTAMSDLCYTGLLFGLYALAGVAQKRVVTSSTQPVQ